MKKITYIALGLAALLVAAPAFAQTYYPTYTQPSYGYACPALGYNLYIGLSDRYTQGQVTALQQFLSTQGYYQPVTGYFGTMTRANVAQFQQRYSVYPVTGGVGPLTRAAIQRVCGGVVNPPYPTYNAPSIQSVSGPTQLSVGQQGTWSLNVLNASSYLSYSVVWGDEQYYNYGYATPAAQSVSSSGTLSHIYTQPGTYSPRFTVTNQYGQSASATASVVVGGTTQSAPVIYSLSPQQGTVGTTITISGAGFADSNVVHFGVGGRMQVPAYSNGSQITFTIPSTVSPCDVIQTFAVCAQYIQQVTPGTYPVYVSNNQGQSQVINFTVTGSGTTGVGVSAYPSSGPIPFTATFTLSNYSSQYAVDFGDGTQANQLNGPVTHTYTTRGTFTAQFQSDPACRHQIPFCAIATMNLGSVNVTAY